jgi:hypothetical protein
VESRAGLDTVTKKSHHYPYEELNPGSLARSLVPILSELSGHLYANIVRMIKSKMRWARL